MLLTPLSFQGNKKGIFKVNQTEAERREKEKKKWLKSWRSNYELVKVK